MEKINLLDINGHTFSVDVVRYFRFKNNAYLIYTLQEKDTKDYIKLYVVKVMNELEQKVSQTVRRNDEWKQMKGIVKTILAEMKKGQLTCIQDLEISDLENMIICESKNFSIASDLVDILSARADKISNILEITDSRQQIELGETQSIEDVSEEEEIEILELDDFSDEMESSPIEEIEVLEL